MIMIMIMIMRILIRKEANDICNKFGSDVFMAGEITSKEDFDVYYQVCATVSTMMMVLITTMLMLMITTTGDMRRIWFCWKGEKTKRAVDHFFPQWWYNCLLDW